MADEKPKSSAIVKQEYDPVTKQFHVTFASGKEYTVHDFAPEDHQAFMGSSSWGRHFNAHVRTKHRVGPREHKK